MTIKYLIYACAEHNERVVFTSIKVTLGSFSVLMLYLVQIPALKCLRCESLNDCNILSRVLICKTARRAPKSAVGTG